MVSSLIINSVILVGSLLMDSFNKYLLSNILGIMPSPRDLEMNLGEWNKHLRAYAVPGITPTSLLYANQYTLGSHTV